MYNILVSTNITQNVIYSSIAIPVMKITETDRC